MAKLVDPSEPESSSTREGRARREGACAAARWATCKVCAVDLRHLAIRYPSTSTKLNTMVTSREAVEAGGRIDVLRDFHEIISMPVVLMYKHRCGQPSHAPPKKPENPIPSSMCESNPRTPGIPSSKAGSNHHPCRICTIDLGIRKVMRRRKLSKSAHHGGGGQAGCPWTL